LENQIKELKSDCEEMKKKNVSVSNSLENEIQARRLSEDKSLKYDLIYGENCKLKDEVVRKLF